MKPKLNKQLKFQSIREKPSTKKIDIKKVLEKLSTINNYYLERPFVDYFAALSDPLIIIRYIHLT